MAVARAVLGDKATAKELTLWADALSKLERGQNGHQNPSLDRIKAIAKGLGMSLADLFAEIARLVVADESPAAQGLADHESLPQFGSEERIKTVALQVYREERDKERRARSRKADDRLSAEARAKAAERGVSPREHGDGDVRGEKKG